MAGLIRLAVLDDHPAITEGLASMLAAAPDIELVGTARDVPGARVLLRETEPDVVLCDVELAGGGRGFELLEERLDESVTPAVIFLSAYDYPAFRATAMARGAAGYLVKTAQIGEILQAIRTAATGGLTFTSRDRRSARSARRPPSERELEVIKLISAGRTNDQIASEMVIGPKTVESHLRRLFARYSVDNRTRLAMLALREGWIDKAAL